MNLEAIFAILVPSFVPFGTWKLVQIYIPECISVCILVWFLELTREQKMRVAFLIKSPSLKPSPRSSSSPQNENFISPLSLCSPHQPLLKFPLPSNTLSPGPSIHPAEIFPIKPKSILCGSPRGGTKGRRSPMKRPSLSSPPTWKDGLRIVLSLYLSLIISQDSRLLALLLPGDAR